MKLLKNVIDRIPILSRRAEDKLISGEQPPVVFVSSVMDKELGGARKEVVDYVKARGFVPWAFEYTPGSSEKVDAGYLRKVRESDFVIWLVGGKTTLPVVSEIREALSSNNRLLLFLLPVVQRDEETRNLLDEVGQQAKWVEVSEDRPLSEALEKTINDEITRAIRKKPGLSRIARLQELENESRARSIARWQASGVQLEKAIDLYSDRSLGNPPMPLINLLEEKSVAVVTGNFGAGKSLLAERILQDHISRFVKDSSLPVPVFVSAANDIEDLKERVLENSEGLGNPRLQGAFVVIDGVDEAGLENFSKILFVARSLVNTWEKTSVIITSRPTHVFEDIEERYPIAELDDDEIIDLVYKVSDIEVDPRIIITLPQALRDAIKKPLFAILWAKFLEQQNAGNPQTTGDLIRFLVEDATQTLDNKARELLEVLAVSVIDGGGANIQWRVICTQDEINLLLETRLVSRSDDRVGFPLPILAQWFAADGLINGRIDINEISLSMARLERWRYPLIVVASMFSHRDVTKILSPVVNNNPGIAARIISEGIPGFDFESQQELPASMECGQRLRQAYAAWTSGIGELAKYIAPINDDGALLTIGVNSTGNRLAEAWYNGTEEVEDVVELPYGFLKIPEYSTLWYPVRSGPVGSKMAWAWRWSLDGLTSKLDNFIQRRDYVPVGGYMFREKMWERAINTMRHGDLYDKAIDLHELRQRTLNIIKEVGEDQFTPCHELHEYVIGMIESGEEALLPPWPVGDIEHKGSGGIWEGYSEERVLERAEAVYGAALEEYERLVNGLFNRLKPKMRIGTLLPVVMHGNIRFQDSPRGPCLDWYFEPRVSGSNSVVRFNFVEKIEKLIDDEELILLNQRMRPEAKEWLSAFRSYSSLDIFYVSPVTRIVYGWLEDDLRSIEWL